MVSMSISVEYVKDMKCHHCGSACAVHAGAGSLSDGELQCGESSELFLTIEHTLLNLFLTKLNTNEIYNEMI